MMDSVLIVLFAAGIMIAVGIFVLIIAGVSRILQRNRHLQRHGQVVLALIGVIHTHQERDPHVQLSHQFIHAVTAQWVDPQTQQIFTFQGHFRTEQRHYQIGGTVPVLIEPANPLSYHMQLP